MGSHIASDEDKGDSMITPINFIYAKEITESGNPRCSKN